MPKVSVIMPVFNGEQYIQESIDSVLGQSMSDLELLVVNDGSTDKTLDIVKSCAGMDKRVKIIDRPNSGKPSFPKNDGISAASGEFICFLDHDDLYDQDRISRLLAGLESNSDWVATFHDCRYIDSQGQDMSYVYLREHDFVRRASDYLTPIAEEWYECNEKFYIYQSLVSGAMHTSTVMIAVNRLPADVVKFDTEYTICDDSDLWIRLGMQGKVGYLNEVLSSYRQHQASITRNKEKFLLDTARLHELNYKRVQKLLEPDKEKQLRIKVASCIEDIAYNNYRQLRLAEARSAYFKAFTWYPRVNTVFLAIKTFIPKSVLGFKSKE